MKQKPFLLSFVTVILCILLTAGCIRVGADPDTPQKSETPAVTEAAEPTPEPTGIVSLYAVPKPTPTMIVEPTPQPIVTPQPMPQPQPMLIRPSNPWRINVRNIFLNMFGGENSSFAQRVMNVFDNFFSRWR